jgi:hypothetical protein
MTHSEKTQHVWDWADGRIHVQPILFSHHMFEARFRRERNFHTACLSASPGLADWPEFKDGLRQYRLDHAYAKGTLSAEVCGLLIARRNKSVGPWLKRGAWMNRRGKDPMDRRRCRRSEREFYKTVMEVIELQKRQRALPAVIRATGS